MGEHYRIRLERAGINKPITNPTHRDEPDMKHHAAHRGQGACAASAQAEGADSRILGGFEKGILKMACEDGRDSKWFERQAKRSDLADCLSMAMDYL